MKKVEVRQDDAASFAAVNGMPDVKFHMLNPPCFVPRCFLRPIAVHALLTALVAMCTLSSWAADDRPACYVAQANSQGQRQTPVVDTAKAAPKPLITGIRANTGAHGEERLIFSMQGATAPAIFFIEGDPVRLVCDFLKADVAAGVPTVMRPAGRMIQQVRIGIHGDPERKVRVVLDLAPGIEYEIDEYFRPEENSYELIVRPAAGVTPTADH